MLCLGVVLACLFGLTACSLFNGIFNFDKLDPEPANNDGTFRFAYVQKGYYSGTEEGYRIEELLDKSLKEISIPRNFNNLPVVALDRSLFKDCDKITKLTIPDTVTHIADRAFEGCSSITELIIPDSVTYIGSGAFRNCSSLTELVIPDNVRLFNTGTTNVFANCDNLQKLTGPAFALDDPYFPTKNLETVVITSGESIPQNCFRECNKLISVTIPDSVTSIGDSAFSGCSSLTSITIPDSVEIIGEGAFIMSGITKIKLPDSVVSLGRGAFYNCENLAEVDLGQGLTEIQGDTWPSTGCFQNCTSLSKVKLNNVIRIGACAFSNCTALSTTLDFPDSIEEIGAGAFEGCAELQGTNGGKNIKTIGGRAFYNCGKLLSISIEENLETAESSAFQGCNAIQYVYYNAKNCKKLSLGISSIREIKFTENVKTIPAKAFWGCKNLIKISLPSSLESIGDGAFDDCNKLIEVYNRSNLTITAGQYNNGSVAAYAKNVYSPAGGRSHLKTALGSYIFYQDISAGNKYYLMGFDTFSDLGEKITLPDGVYEYGYVISYYYDIYDYAFYGNTSLKELTVPQSVQSIGRYAFKDCSSLTSVTIPNSVTSIDYDAFEGCSILTIYCEAVNKPYNWNETWNGYRTVVWDCNNNDKDENGYAYTIVDGIRYSLKEGIATVERQPCGISGSIIIPSSITYKSESYSVTSICYSAFEDCGSLTSIIIPNSVTSIGTWVFVGCRSLKDINFEGTKAQWKAIEKDGSWDSNTRDYTVHCTDGDLSKSEC